MAKNLIIIVTTFFGGASFAFAEKLIAIIKENPATIETDGQEKLDDLGEEVVEIVEVVDEDGHEDLETVDRWVGTAIHPFNAPNESDLHEIQEKNKDDSPFIVDKV